MMANHKPVTYSCGHTALYRPYEVIPAKCPECGAPMYDG